MIHGEVKRAPAPFVADELGKGAIALSGPWQFHLGDDAQWADPTTADETGQNGWEQLAAEQPWGTQGHPSQAGFGWYRKHLHLTPAALQQVGREGYEQMISDDIHLARALFERISQYAELEALTQSLSITTFRFVPTDLISDDQKAANYLDKLNLELLTRVQASGEAYLSNAVVHGRFALRACIVNFRTSLADIESLLPIVVRIGKALDLELRPHSLQTEAS
jgi:hypothetical protein